jgi:hypothetical protein
MEERKKEGEGKLDRVGEFEDSPRPVSDFAYSFPVTRFLLVIEFEFGSTSCDLCSRWLPSKMRLAVPAFVMFNDETSVVYS